MTKLGGQAGFLVSVMDKLTTCECCDPPVETCPDTTPECIHCVDSFTFSGSLDASITWGDGGVCSATPSFSLTAQKGATITCPPGQAQCQYGDTLAYTDPCPNLPDPPDPFGCPFGVETVINSNCKWLHTAWSGQPTCNAPEGSHRVGGCIQFPFPDFAWQAVRSFFLFFKPDPPNDLQWQNWGSVGMHYTVPGGPTPPNAGCPPPGTQNNAQGDITYTIQVS